MEKVISGGATMYKTKLKIINNRIKCNHCNDVIESKTVHDYKECKCGKVAVDGGKDYMKRSFKSPTDYTDLSITKPQFKTEKPEPPRARIWKEGKEGADKKDLNKLPTLSPLDDRISDYLNDTKVIRAIIDSADLIIRLRMGQLGRVTDTLNHYCTIYQEGKGVDLDEPLYRAIELGELLLCKAEHGECSDAKSCWITRKGAAKCKNKVGWVD